MMPDSAGEIYRKGEEKKMCQVLICFHNVR